MVTGIWIQESNDTYLKSKIKFPGGVSFYSSIDKITEMYKTSPFNLHYNSSQETFGYDEHRYRNDEWEITFYIFEGKIKEVMYHYYGY